MIENVRRSIMLTSEMHEMVTNKASAHKVTADDVIAALFKTVSADALNKSLDRLSADRRKEKAEAAKRRKELAEATEKLSPEDFEAIMKMINERS